MVEYVGLDVSLKETSICVVEASGEIVFEGRVMSEPDAIAAVIGEKAGSVARIGLETGPTSTWLWTELHGRGLPVVCLDARHAKAALKIQINNAMMRRDWRTCHPTWSKTWWSSMGSRHCLPTNCAGHGRSARSSRWVTLSHSSCT